MQDLDEYKNTPMPFGQYEGVKMKDVPDYYIKWLIRYINNFQVCEMAKIEMKRRMAMRAKQDTGK